MEIGPDQEGFFTFWSKRGGTTLRPRRGAGPTHRVTTAGRAPSFSPAGAAGTPRPEASGRSAAPASSRRGVRGVRMRREVDVLDRGQLRRRCGGDARHATAARRRVEGDPWRDAAGRHRRRARTDRRCAELGGGDGCRRRCGPDPGDPVGGGVSGRPRSTSRRRAPSPDARRVTVPRRAQTGAWSPSGVIDAAGVGSASGVGASAARAGRNTATPIAASEGDRRPRRDRSRAGRRRSCPSPPATMRVGVRAAPPGAAVATADRLPDVVAHLVEQPARDAVAELVGDAGAEVARHERSEHGDADRAAHLAGGVVHRRPDAGLRARQRAHDRVGAGREHVGHPEAEQHR